MFRGTPCMTELILTEFRRKKLFKLVIHLIMSCIQWELENSEKGKQCVFDFVLKKIVLLDTFQIKT